MNVKVTGKLRLNAKAARVVLDKQGRAKTRQLLARARQSIVPNIPVSDRDTPSFREQTAKYGRLKNQVKVSFRRSRLQHLGWLWRYKLGRGKAFWLHFLGSGVKGRNYPTIDLFSPAVNSAVRDFESAMSGVQSAALKAAGHGQERKL